MKAQLNLRISGLTERQIAALQERLGVSKTELITVAINRIYEKEIEIMKVKVIRYSKEHEHWYTFNSHIAEYEFRRCVMTGNWSQCVASKAPLPMATKFDGIHKLQEDEFDLLLP
jgi:hypothetical protein